MRTRHAALRGFAIWLLTLALVSVPVPAAARDAAPPSNGYSGVVGIAAALGTLVYAPLKLTYAVTGGVIGSLAWIMTGGDGEIAGSILQHSLKGDYVISPAHLEGEKSLEFRGRRR